MNNKAKWRENIFNTHVTSTKGFPGGLDGKQHLPAMLETWVRSLGQEDPLEKEMADHSSILAWRIPWTKEPGGLQFLSLQRVRHDRATNTNQYQEYKKVSTNQ